NTQTPVGTNFNSFTPPPSRGHYFVRVTDPSGANVVSRTASICVLARIRAVRPQSLNPNPSAMVITTNASYVLSTDIDSGDTVVWYGEDSHPERQVGTGPTITVTPLEKTTY